MIRFLFLYPVVVAFWLFIAWAIWSVARSMNRIAESLQQIALDRKQPR